MDERGYGLGEIGWGVVQDEDLVDEASYVGEHTFGGALVQFSRQAVGPWDFVFGELLDGSEDLLVGEGVREGGAERSG